MKFLQRPDFWPWCCGLVTLTAMILGLAADGLADGLAALLLCIPPAVVLWGLLRAWGRDSD